MKKLFASLSLFMIIALPIQIYNIPFGFVNLSLDRMLFFFCFVLLPFFVKFLDIEVLVIILLLFLSTFFSFLMADNSSLLITYMPSWIQSLVVFIISFIVSKKGFIKLEKVHQIHSYIFIFFVLYSFYFMYILRTTSFSYPFPSFLPNLEEDQHKMSQLIHLRIFFPLSAAPRLGFVLGFLLLTIPIKKYYLPTNNKIKDGIIAILLMFGVLLTVSRGPILSLILSFSIYHLLTLKDDLKTGFNNSLYFVVALICVNLIIMQFVNLESFKFDRLSNLDGDDDSFLGHASVRLLSVSTIFSSPILNTFFGYGIGHCQDVLGISSAHSSFFTILLEQGVLGLIAFTSLFIVLISNSIKLYIKARRRGLKLRVYRHLVAVCVFLTLIHLVYDAISLAILWSYNGLLLGLIKHEANEIKYCNTRL